MHRNAFHCPDVGKEKHGCIVIVGKKDLQDFLFARRLLWHQKMDMFYIIGDIEICKTKCTFLHISKSWNPNIMRCVSMLYFRQIMTALHFLCIGACWRVLPLINNWCHQVLMYWFTISSTLCRTNNFFGGNMITHRPRNRNKDKVAWWGQARANPSSAIALHQQWACLNKTSEVVNYLEIP